MSFKKLIRPVIPGIFFLFLVNSTFADDGRKHELSLGVGIITPSEFDGVTSTSYMDIPSSFGTLFFTYRYHLSNRIAIGLSAGIDNSKGPLTYGPPHSAYYQIASTGTYIRHTQTIAAPELYFKYDETRKYTHYGYISVAYTFSKLEKVINDNLMSSYYYNGVLGPTGLPPYLPPTNPYYETKSYFNYQITFLGIRHQGRVSWFIEFGYGYKGLIHSGISLTL